MKEPIIGRKLGNGTGRHTGASSPALIWRAIEAKFNASRVDQLACCGLTHPEVQSLLQVANQFGNH